MTHTRRNGARLTSQAEIDHKLELAQTALGYRFKDPSVLEAAITHPSAAESDAVHGSYERLEFLGDSILDAIVALEIYGRFADIDEGGLTRIKVSLVSGETLAQVAAGLGFADFIIFGGSERGTGKRGLHSALENVFESVVAALYIDGGIETAHRWAIEVLEPYISLKSADEPENPKSSLQEHCQAHHITPSYRLVSQDGPPHDRTFTSEVLVAGVCAGVGSGRSKKEAESAAAQNALDIMLADSDRLESLGATVVSGAQDDTRGHGLSPSTPWEGISAGQEC